MKERIYGIVEKFVVVEDDFSNYKREVVNDYISARLSREVSIIARKEVLNGKAKFGITGDGKEIPQLAMAKVFEAGDWRSGYYRDQTFMFAKNICTVGDYFAQLYADSENDPFSGGRMMNCHFASPTIDKEGNLLDLVNRHNVSADISCTGGQIARGIGHAYASKVFRKLDLEGVDHLTNNGNEVSFLTIGDGSTSEGAFWEMMNAAGVINVPLVAIVWDDGFSISVPVSYQTTKSSISKAMEGLLIDENGEGIHIFVAKAWDYQELCLVFRKAVNIARKDHKAVLIHVQECTQPQGHSSSGSHERYKTQERLQWETDFDCIAKMEEWMLANAILSQADIDEITESTAIYVKKEVTKAYELATQPILQKQQEFLSLLEAIKTTLDTTSFINDCKKLINPSFSDLHTIAKKTQYALRKLSQSNSELDRFIAEREIIADMQYHTNLHSNTSRAAINVPAVLPKYDEKPKQDKGYKIINTFFDAAFAKYPNLIALGEDIGMIGDVNQGFVGLQEKYGDTRITDTGIREWTIIGQALGSAMRGLKPIVEIQYIDYLAYAYSPMSDDLATLRYRTNGMQSAPMIVRTRGHRLEGVWHSGSPMGMIINGMKGIYLCVPRNFVQAAGMYNTLLKSDDPGIVVETLNAYRLREDIPTNLTEVTIPLGMPEVLRQGTDVTIVTYGACVKVAMDAAILGEEYGISLEVIDVQTLMPFDLEHTIVHSLQKTNKIIFVDEDISGGSTSYMLKEVIQDQKGFKYLDAAPICLSAKDHRTPYGSDGDYFTKPNPESIFDACNSLMNEINPKQFPR